MRLLALYSTLAIAVLAWAQDQTPQEYIEKYKATAISEMHRSGVPASITMAQGILESRSGNSRLARLANNHFGIKCKGNNWQGEVIYADDDEANECFRAYPNALASYKDHSDFLRNNWRYHPLFDLQRTDYKGWCEGLRKAGYATNNKYGTILISVIERYGLNELDLEGLPSAAEPGIIAESINGLPVLAAKDGETVSTIAKANYVKDRHIRKWNDIPPDGEITTGDIVYLKPKRRRGSESQHKMIEGETMHDVSQKYGIKLKVLYKKNRMEYGTEPEDGTILEMRKKRSSSDSIKLKEETPAWEDKKEEVFVNPHSIPKEVDTTKAGPVNKKDVVVPDYHEVAKGDNIYQIAEKYHVFEEDILRWNPNLNPTAMQLGQRIYLSQEASQKAGADQVLPEPPVQLKPKKEMDQDEVDKVSKDITVDGPIYHQVVKGDTVYNICKRYGITEAELKRMNNLETIIIKLGQSLQVSE